VEEQVTVYELMVVLGETEPVLQPIVVLEQLVELLPFWFSYNRDGNDDVYILSVPYCVGLYHDMVFVQIRKHQRIIILK